MDGVRRDGYMDLPSTEGTYTEPGDLGGRLETRVIGARHDKSDKHDKGARLT